VKKLIKFKVDSEGAVLVRYQIEHQDEAIDTVTLESSDAPSQALGDALQKMADHLLVITAKKDLAGSHAPLIVNTPHFTREPYNEDSDDDTGIFSDECGADLDELERLALLFAEGGERLQKELDFAIAGGDR
jgi:hypothetical protein